jgi:hypothetical protein
VTKLLYVEHSEDNLYMLEMRLELLGDLVATIRRVLAQIVEASFTAR